MYLTYMCNFLNKIILKSSVVIPLIYVNCQIKSAIHSMDHHGPDCMVVGFTTTYAVSAYHD